MKESPVRGKGKPLADAGGCQKEMAQLRLELTKKNRAYILSLENIKKSALDYASLEFKRKSYELAALFKVETLKMLE